MKLSQHETVLAFLCYWLPLKQSPQLWRKMKLLSLLLITAWFQTSALAGVAMPSSVTFRFCYEEKALPPFFLGDGLKVPDKRPGVIIDMLRQLDRDAQYITIHYSRAPWARCMQKLSQGDFDGVVASYSKNRQQYGVYPMKNQRPNSKLAISHKSYCLYNTRGDLRWDGSAFRGKGVQPIAVPRGYSVQEVLNQHGRPFLEVNSTQQAFKLLTHHRVEASVTLCEVGDSLLNSNLALFQSIKRNPQPITQQYGYLLVSKQFQQKHPQTVVHMWHSLSQLKSQHLNDLLHQYANN